MGNLSRKIFYFGEGWMSYLDLERIITIFKIGILDIFRREPGMLQSMGSQSRTQLSD